MGLESWAMLFAGISALAAIVTAGIAGWSLSGSRRDSRDRSRPVVIASLRKGPSISNGVIYLVIENVGPSVARQVEVKFDPPLPSYETTDDGQPGVVAPFLRQRYANPLLMIAPRQTLCNVYSYVTAAKPGNVEPVAEQFTVNIRYADDRNHRYGDSFPLDLSLLTAETQSNPNPSNDPVLRQNKALESIVWELWE